MSPLYQPIRGGGSWFDRPETMRASYPLKFKPSFRYGDLGLRCTLVIVCTSWATVRRQ